MDVANIDPLLHILPHTNDQELSWHIGKRHSPPNTSRPLNSIRPSTSRSPPSRTRHVGLDDESKLKPIAYFSETEKGCVLNVTRCEAITGIAGTPDMDRWHGVRVRLQRGLTRYQGKRVACIEIVAPPTAPRTTVRDRAKPASAPLAAPVDLGEPFEEPPIPAPEAEY